MFNISLSLLGGSFAQLHSPRTTSARSLCALVLSLLLPLSMFADEQKKVQLSNSHPKETIAIKNQRDQTVCNIFITLGEGQQPPVTIEIENLHETNVILLFPRAYPEKELKKLKPSITFDKIFGGTKGAHVIESYKAIHDVVRLEPSDKQALPPLQTASDNVPLIPSSDSNPQITCRLPLYIAKYKSGYKKMLLLEKQVIELQIETDVKPDGQFLNMQKKVDNLVGEIKRVGICPNARHKQNRQKQIKAYQNRIDNLNRDIDALIANKPATATQPYQALKRLLADINPADYEHDCGRHRASNQRHAASNQPKGHNCSHCALSLQQIANKMDDCYKKIYNSANRKQAKAAVIATVNALYKCAAAADCAKHAAAWNNGGTYRTKITNIYNKINQF